MIPAAIDAIASHDPDAALNAAIAQATASADRFCRESRELRIELAARQIVPGNYCRQPNPAVVGTDLEGRN